MGETDVPGEGSKSQVLIVDLGGWPCLTANAAEVAKKAKTVAKAVAKNAKTVAKAMAKAEMATAMGHRWLPPQQARLGWGHRWLGNLGLHLRLPPQQARLGWGHRWLGNIRLHLRLPPQQARLGWICLLVSTA